LSPCAAGQSEATLKVQNGKHHSYSFKKKSGFSGAERGLLGNLPMINEKGLSNFRFSSLFFPGAFLIKGLNSSTSRKCQVKEDEKVTLLLHYTL